MPISAQRLFPLICAAMAIMPLLPAKEAKACACCGTYKVVGVAQWDVLNVRSGPGTGFNVITSLAPGEGCIIKTGERRGNWVRVEHGGNQGWVHRRYLAIIR